MLHLDVGLSSIRASQQALYAISNNVANANTDGYHRQRVELVDRHPIVIGNLQIGTGVDVEQLTRLRDTATAGSLVATNSKRAESEALLQILEEVESALLPTSGSLIDSVSNFFNEIEQLAAQPATVTIRDAVLAAADRVAHQVSQLDSRFNQLRTNHAIAIAEEVDLINQATEQIAVLNKDIRIATHSGRAPNSILDQRDRLVSDLSESVEVSLQSFLVEESPIVAANGAVLIAEDATQLVATTDDVGNATVVTEQGAQTVLPLSGRLAGLLTGQELINQVQQSLHDWTATFVQAIDQIHATGLGHAQNRIELTGTRVVSDATIPLAEIDTPFTIESGALFVSLTEQTTGERTTHRLDIDPQADSLNDVLLQLDTISNLSATYLPDAERAHLRASHGYSIDFAGGIDQSPSTSALTGTATPTLSGFPISDNNDNWTTTIIGSGTVGVTSGLSVEVTNTITGEAIGTFSIGDDYLPGEQIHLGEGIELAFNGGTVNNGESFTFDLVANPDETGLLTALGIGTLFSGTPSDGIKINPFVAQSPRNIAASRTGEAADAANLARIIDARDAILFADRNESIEDRLASITTANAFQIEAERASLEYYTEQTTHFENIRDSVSGVDVNEELLNMLQFQRQFQAASRFITAIDQSLNELMQLIG